MNQNLKERYDVVIVGAGPAGLMTAKTLAQAGREVLVIEKNKIIGPKVCGGGLTVKDFQLGIPEKLAEKSFKKIYLHTLLQSSVIQDKKPFIATIERKSLGQWMKKEAEKLGVKILCDQVTDLSKKQNRVILKSEKKLSYNYLIGADGSNSVVRNKLGIPKEKCLIAFQYLVKKVYLRMELFFDYKKFGSWYVWIFPHKNFTSIGTGCDPRIFSAQKSKENFEKWLLEKNINLTGAKYEAWPINYDYRGYEFGNIFLAGDAAGFTSGLTGEGIYSAMVSGNEIAKKIINPKHNLREINQILKTKKLHEVILDLFEKGNPIFEIEIEIINLLAKTKFFDQEFIKIFF